MASSVSNYKWPIGNAYACLVECVNIQCFKRKRNIVKFNVEDALREVTFEALRSSGERRVGLFQSALHLAMVTSLEIPNSVALEHTVAHAELVAPEVAPEVALKVINSSSLQGIKLTKRDIKVLKALVSSVDCSSEEWFKANDIDFSILEFSSTSARNTAFSHFTQKLIESGHLVDNQKLRAAKRYKPTPLLKADLAEALSKAPDFQEHNAVEPVESIIEKDPQDNLLTHTMWGLTFEEQGIEDGPLVVVDGSEVFGFKQVAATVLHKLAQQPPGSVFSIEAIKELLFDTAVNEASPESIRGAMHEITSRLRGFQKNEHVLYDAQEHTIGLRTEIPVNRRTPNF